jgi:mannose-6-phosphate isomerase-like protein (cupin superfamily)
MNRKRLAVHEDEIEPIADMCGQLRELINPRTVMPKPSNLSVASFVVDAGRRSEVHYHLRTEEVYYILSGWGAMMIDGDNYEIKPGHAIFIPAGSRHMIANAGDVPLRFVCMNSPVYSWRDVFKP